MLFSELLDSWQPSPGRLISPLPPDWRQGRAVFGGLQAAIALGAMRTLVPDMPLRCLQATLLAPPQGDQLQADARILRQGKNAIHVEARLIESGQELALVVGIFGSERQSSVERVLVQPPVAGEQRLSLPYVEGMSPSFTQHFDAAYLRGGLPYSGVAEPELVVELELKDKVASTEFHVVALADYVPPVALSYVNRPVPGSTMTWMLEMLTEKLAGLPLAGWRADAELVAASHGYTQQSVILWAPDGSPVALSRQSMVVFG